MNNTTGCSADWGDGWVTANGSGSTANISVSGTPDISTYTIHAPTFNTTGTGTGTGTGAANGGGCNESKAFDNNEKALYHGLKAAYRMSRESDGEYGTDDPPYKTAARMAANAAIGYFLTTGQTHTREASFEYIDENFAREAGFVESYFSDPPLDTRVGEAEFEAAMAHSWEQIDTKRNHFDAARTALAAADLFLGGELEARVAEVVDE